jgi:carboxypeptidase family protein
MKFAQTFLIAVLSLSAMPGAGNAATLSGKVTVRNARDNADAVVYIAKIPGKTFPPPHDPLPLDQRDLKFIPHVLPILVGTKVAFPNSDVVRHHVFSPGPTQKFSLGTYRVGETKYLVFNSPGIVDLLCNIHAEMSAYVVVTETPYYAVTDSQGNYSIENLPPGRYVVRVWHERNSKFPPREIEVTGNLKENFELK